MFTSIFPAAAQGGTELRLWTFLLGLGAALALGLLLSGTYLLTHRGKSPSQAFAFTLVVLPAVVTVIILLIGNSVARAFSLAGAFQIIRFRSAPGGPKDITYVLFSMAVGLCCGMGYLFYGAAAAVLLCGVMVVLERINFGRLKGQAQLLRITVPENLDYTHVFDDIFQDYAKTCERIKVKTTNLGSLFELHYRVTMKAGSNEKRSAF